MKTSRQELIPYKLYTETGKQIHKEQEREREREREDKNNKRNTFVWIYAKMFSFIILDLCHSVDYKNESENESNETDQIFELSLSHLAGLLSRTVRSVQTLVLENLY